MPKHNLTIRIDDDLHSWLKQEAEYQQRSVANFILYVLNSYRQLQNNSQKQENLS